MSSQSNLTKSNINIHSAVSAGRFSSMPFGFALLVLRRASSRWENEKFILIYS